MTLDVKINQFATRCFRDQADADYISARMACSAQLVSPYLWASQQAIEKYLKCILLLNRIPASSVKHDLAKALDAIQQSGKLALDLTPATQNFIKYIDDYGQYRYLEVSTFIFKNTIIELDRTVWELRRFCTLDDSPRKVKLIKGVAPPKIRISGGYLETILDDKNNPARAPLLKGNAFFTFRSRKRVAVRSWMVFTNAPLWLHPEILDEVLKYVYLPKDVRQGYRLVAQVCGAQRS